MSGNHIPFDKLSDLYDDEIASKEERAELMRHIESCRACGLEYRLLGNTLRLCRDVAGMPHPLENLSPQTLGRIKTSRKRRLYLRSLPAMAASVLVIAGIGLFNAGIIGVHDRGDMAADGSRRSYSESEQVIEIIRSHKAGIAQVTDEYVEGIVPVASFNDLRKQLGPRKVAYLLVDDASESAGASWSNPIEKVGLDEGPVISNVNPQGSIAGPGKRYVRFRVFR
ncbi:MAG TPA: hypothetical protein PL180_03045 [Spirochaetota bacterium]|nr:hypothetical protein [Spirochaetota bacterium]HQJ70380.1 hypothetical protein [Spirochaetota bacterium]HRS78051.1 hypothetical protein [Spirochaetota bacterium]HRT76148.1 hypothetical protein [Spirochaetota bacterium]